MACLRSCLRTFAVLGRMFDCLPIRTLVTPASTLTLLNTRQRDAVFWSGGPFHFLWHSAWLSWSRSGLDWVEKLHRTKHLICDVADQMLRSVQFFFLSAEVWERVSEHGYRKMAVQALGPIGEQERDWQREEEARKSEVCHDQSLRGKVLRQDPLIWVCGDFNFLHHGIEEVERHLL